VTDKLMLASCRLQIGGKISYCDGRCSY